MKPRIGDFVAANLAGKKEPRQGVYVRNNQDGTVLVRGELEIYLCEGPEGVAIVEDENLILPNTKILVERVREELCLH